MMPRKLKRAGPIETTETPGPPKAEPNRVVIQRTMTNPDGSEERVINLIEILKPGLMRTYQETRHIGPQELPKKRG